MNDRGMFVLDRAIFDHPFFQDEFCDGWAFAWMLAEAAWKPRRTYQSGRLVELHRGQFSHSVRYMARRFKWSVKKVRCFLRKLASDGTIRIGSEMAISLENDGLEKGTDKGTARGTARNSGISVITICNYSHYQFSATDSFSEKGTAWGTAWDTAGAHEGHKAKKEIRKERTTTVVGEPENVSRPDVSQPAQPDFRKQAAELTNQIYAIFGLNLDFIPPAWMGLQYALEAGLRGNKWHPDLCRLASVKMAATKKPDGFQYLIPAIEKEHQSALALLKKLEKADELPKDQRELALFTTINGNGGQRRGRGFATFAAEAYRSALANGYKG